MTKSFGEVVANAAVSLDVWPGEVHCLLGENGAGKSTLIAMLAGLLQPDEGSIEIAGVQRLLTTPAVSSANGIGVVFQHSTLIPTMTVLENLILAQGHGFWLDRVAPRTRLKDLSDLLGTEIDAAQRVSELGLGQRQQLEIAIALRAHVRVLVLDEPTSMLSAKGIEDLKTRIRRLAASGVAVIFVTHKLDEALGLCDRVTVLREGRVVRRFGAGELRKREAGSGRGKGGAGSESRFDGEKMILAAMFGEEPYGPGDPETSTSEWAGRQTAFDAESQEALRLDAVSTADAHDGTPIAAVTLQVYAGQIVGIAGIDGNGQRHLAEVIAGQIRPVTGQVMLDGQNINRASIRQRQRLGVRYVTDDRLHEGIAGSFSVAINLLLKRLGEKPFWRLGVMRSATVQAHAENLIAQYDIRTSSPSAPAGTLSGGNIQKILLARELAGEPRVVVFHKPSYGLDLKTVRLVHHEISRLAAAGMAVLLISTDLDELTELADRVEVMSHGRIVGSVENDGDRVRERVGALIAGGVGAE